LIQRRLAGRRKSDQPDIGDGFEFQREVAGLPLLSEQCESRGLAGPRRQRSIAQTTPAALGGGDAGTASDQIGQ